MEDDVNEEYLKMLARGKENFAQLKFLDNDPKTIKQNALSHALIKDIADWYADVPVLVDYDLRALYELNTHEEFNHTDATKDDMNQWLDFLIELIIREGVPLKKRYEYLLENNSFFYFSLKYRKCCICGRPHADVHHAFNRVGMGGNRKKHNHKEAYFESLCRIHHTEAHKISQKVFDKKYGLTAIKMDLETLIKIGVQRLDIS